MNAFSEFVQALLGLGVEAKELTSLQVSMRGIIVFVAALVMMRIGSKRSLAEKSAFDAALMIIIASVLARAVNGSAPFVPTLVVGFVLVLLHRLFAFGAYASHAFGILIKGKPVVIVENEGNGRLVTALPRIHVAVMGMERVVADWDQAAHLLELLPMAAIGQDASTYLNLVTGPRAADEGDGPE